MGNLITLPDGGPTTWADATPVLPTPFDWATDFEPTGKTESPFTDQITADSGVTSLEGLVDYSKVEACFLSAVGYSCVDPATIGTAYLKIRRKPPIRHPFYTWMRCSEVKIRYRTGNDPRFCDNWNEDEWEDLVATKWDELVPRYPRYDQQKAVVELMFRAAPPMNLFRDDEISTISLDDGNGEIRAEWQRYLEITTKPVVEALQNTSGQSYKWAEKAMPADNQPKELTPIAYFPPHILKSTTHVQAVWRQCPLDYIAQLTGDYVGGIPRYANFDAIQGRVNSSSFMGRKKEVLYCAAPQIELKPSPLRYTDNRTHFTADVTFSWLLFDPPDDMVGSTLGNGLQLAPFAGDQKYYLITSDGAPTGQRIYHEADLAGLFYPYTITP